MGQGISYSPRMAIKSQVLVDFIIEWTEVQMPSVDVDREYWMMYFDGSLMKKGTGAGLVFVSPLEVRMRYMVHLYFPSSNNVAKRAGEGGVWPRASADRHLHQRSAQALGSL